MNLHPSARTTPAIRREIQESTLTERELAKKYNVTRTTIRKWRHRDDVQDRSHRIHTRQQTLSEPQEHVLLVLRESFWLTLDDLVYIAKTYLTEKASRSAIHRLLAREGLSNLRKLQQAQQEDSNKPVKQFKNYEPGFLHIDIKYLPQMPDEDDRRYLFVAIDRATRWVHTHIYKRKTAESAARFLKRVQAACPFSIRTVLTDNGKEFTDRFIANGEREPTGRHEFDQACTASEIEHRLIKPKHPQTNGMVERFNGRIAEILKTTTFESAEELEQSLKHYVNLYNHHIPQKALDHKSPLQTMKEWQASHHDLFVKRVHLQAEPDN